jgi:hypothetical protein
MVGRFSPYATDSPERTYVAFYLAALSIGLGYALHAGLVAAHLAAPWYVDVPSPVVIYGILWKLFDKYIWRWNVLRLAGIVRVPDLNGDYRGTLYSSFDRDNGKRHAVHLNISQSWTTILICGHFSESRSYNLITGVSVLDAGTPRLTYEYVNEPKEGAPEALHVHPGTVWFDVSFDRATTTLVGEYYTGRDRRNSGMIEVTRTVPSAQ